MITTYDRYDAGVLLSCVLYLYLNLFALPATPYLLSGDQVYFWVDAQRLLHGERIYRDFFQFTPPGTDLIYWWVFRLLGAQVWTTNLVVLMVCFGLCLICLRLSRSVLPRPAAALATLLYLVLILGLTLNATHHLFSALAVFGAVAVLIDRTATKTLLAGVLVGAASFFTQTRGPVAAAAIAAWLMIDGRRSGQHWMQCLQRVAMFVAAALLSWLALSGYYLKSVGLGNLWFFQVEYVRHYLVSAWSLERPDSSSAVALIKWLFSFVALPVIYLAALWRCSDAGRYSNPQQASRVLLLGLVGTVLYLEVTPGPSWLRFFCVALPAVILLIWLLRQRDQTARYASALLWVLVIGAGLEQTWAKHRLNDVEQGTPAGAVATTALTAQKLSWLEAHTTAGDYFLQTQWPGLYLPLALRNPIYLDLVISPGADALGYTALAIRQVEARRVRYIEWSPRLDRPGYTLGSFHAFLTGHYRPIQTFPDGDEIWERAGRD